MASRSNPSGHVAVVPAGGIKTAIKDYFKLADSKPQTIANEIWGGIVMYLVSLYVLNAAVGWQAGSCPTCFTTTNVTSSAGYTAMQYRALSGAISLAAGISTIAMGVFGNMPIVVAPGITGIALQTVSTVIGPNGAKAAALIVGLLIFTFALFSKRIKMISSIPEDYRLGVAAGKGGVIALIALRNTGLIHPTLIGFNNFFSYNVILSLVGFMIIIFFQSRRLVTLSFVGEIVIITTASLIIRGATGTTIVTEAQGAIIDLAQIAGVPSFAGFIDANAFGLFKYVIGATIHTLIDILATVTAIILMCVVRTNIGYDKETFTSVLSESAKCYNIFMCIAVCQVLVSPFLGVAPVTPFIQSTAGIMVGARTGLSAVVCGTLFLISTLFASPIASIIPLSAVGPVVFVSCLPVVQALKYVDFDSPSRTIPAFLAFFLMTLTNSIGVGVSFSFMILFVSFALSADWVILTPQMVCSFLVCTVLLLIETGLVTSMNVLGAVIGGFSAAAIIISLLMAYPLRGYFYKNPGLVTNSHTHSNHPSDPNQVKSIRLSKDKLSQAMSNTPVHRVVSYDESQLVNSVISEREDSKA